MNCLVRQTSSMQLQEFTQWEAISIVQLVSYLVLLVIFLVITYHKSIPVLPFFILMTLFIVFKITGAILGLVLMHSDFNMNLFIATYIFDTISLGFITRGIGALVQHMLKKKFGLGKEKLNFWPYKLLTVILIAAVVINIVGTTRIEDGDSSLLKVGSILFLVGILLMIGLLLMHRNQLAQILIFACIILIIRCIYSILSAFKGIDFDHPSKYIIYFGEYKFYTFLGYLPETLAAILILISFWYL